MSTKMSKEQAPGFSSELLDELLGEAKTAQELLGSSAFAAVVDDHIGTARGEQFGDLGTDTPRGSGDEGGFIR